MLFRLLPQRLQFGERGVLRTAALALDPESALKKTNRKFKRRFQWLEAELQREGRRPQDASLEELESLWQKSKQQEAGKASKPQP